MTIFSRLRHASKPFFNSTSTLLWSSDTYSKLRQLKNPVSVLVSFDHSFWSLVLFPQSNPSLCELPNANANAHTEFMVKGSHKELPQQFINELKAVCQDYMTMDYEERYNHGKPQNSFHKAVNIPDLVVFARSEEEVCKIVKLCDKHKVPIVPYGGTTSIEGHTLSPHGGVCIDMSSMKAVKALHVDDMDVVVESGIGWMELIAYLEPYGLFFPLDLGRGATIGGMCATRCSGSLAVRYGTMRDNVISLKGVIANGEVKDDNNGDCSCGGIYWWLPLGG